MTANQFHGSYVLPEGGSWGKNATFIIIIINFLLHKESQIRHFLEALTNRRNFISFLPSDPPPRIS